MAIDKEIVLFENKSQCCGCGACMNACPRQAIEMKEDEYGFIYPMIDEEACIKCGACMRACAYQNTEVENRPISAYAAVNTNNEQKLTSASGGVFSAIASKVISEGGIVFGCSLDNIDGKLVPHHIGVEKIEDLPKLQGSKYVQSYCEYAYKQALENLKNNRMVLYSGTPCQIAGLYGFLKKDYDNLITIDLICHGVPNAKMFNDFLEMETKKYKAKAISTYIFRDKKKGWGMNGRYDFILPDGNRKVVYKPARLASYNTLFLDGLTYRENCYTCKYACEHRPGDITIGDYWGIIEEHPEVNQETSFVEKDGISCVIVNTEKGDEFIKFTGDYLKKIYSTFDKISHRNGQLISPSVKSPKRDIIMNLYRDEGYVAVEGRYRYAYRKQRKMHFVFNKMPRKIRFFLKKIIKNK